MRPAPQPWHGGAGVLLVVPLLAAGCMTFGNGRNTAVRPTTPDTYTQQPDVARVVAHLNANAERVRAVESRDLDIDIKVGSQTFGVRGDLYCQKPRNFRMRAKMPIGAKPVADFGSNDREFWFWNSEDKPPYLYHASYDALAGGNVPLPFPLHPDWVLEALGMATLNPAGDFQISQIDPRGGSRTFELTERSVSAQGQPVTKVTVFNNFAVQGNTPQIKAHRFTDARGQLVFEAEVQSVRRFYTSPTQQEDSVATVPYEVVLRWPAQQLSLKLKLDGMRLNNPETDAARNPRLFVKPPGHQTWDLARGLPPGAGGTQRVSGWAQ